MTKAKVGLGILPEDEYEIVSEPVVTYEDVIKREG